jgi:ATP-dependent DNA helicase DinG
MGNRLDDELDDDLARSLNRARDRANRALDALRKIPKDSKPEVIGRKERATQAATHLVMDIDIALDMVEGTVAWVEGPRFPALKVASIDVSGVLSDKLWSTRAAILTSATIPRNLSGRIGLAEFPHDEIDVGSPFDFENAGLLYCAAHIPDPRSEEYRDALHAEIESLVMAAGGRTLALFTSWRAMNLAKEHLLDRLPYTLLAQGDSPKQVLMDTFTDDEESVLLATMSFWQGVDIPGRALSCVIIDRLPFPRPDDPLLGARRDQVGAAAFREIDVPRASMLLAQGAGRLIRSSEDRGVVAVLDSRLSKSRSYRWDLIKALPPLRRTKDRDEAMDFLKNIRDS